MGLWLDGGEPSDPGYDPLALNGGLCSPTGASYRYKRQGQRFGYSCTGGSGSYTWSYTADSLGACGFSANCRLGFITSDPADPVAYSVTRTSTTGQDIPFSAIFGATGNIALEGSPYAAVVTITVTDDVYPALTQSTTLNIGVLAIS